MRKNVYPEIKGTRDNSHKESDNFQIDNLNSLAPNSKDYFQILAENARDLIFHTRISPFRFEYVSPSSTHITGYTPEEFYADPFLAKKCIHPDDFNIVTDPSTWHNSNKTKPVEIR